MMGADVFLACVSHSSLSTPLCVRMLRFDKAQFQKNVVVDVDGRLDCRLQRGKFGPCCDIDDANCDDNYR